MSDKGRWSQTPNAVSNLLYKKGKKKKKTKKKGIVVKEKVLEDKRSSSINVFSSPPWRDKSVESEKSCSESKSNPKSSARLVRNKSHLTKKDIENISVKV